MLIFFDKKHSFLFQIFPLSIYFHNESLKNPARTQDKNLTMKKECNIHVKRKSLFPIFLVICLVIFQNDTHYTYAAS